MRPLVHWLAGQTLEDLPHPGELQDIHSHEGGKAEPDDPLENAQMGPQAVQTFRKGEQAAFVCAEDERCRPCLGLRRACGLEGIIRFELEETHASQSSMSC